MPNFFALHRLRGFDATATPPWQMVPLGFWREVGLTESAGLALSSTNPAVATAEFARDNPASLARSGQSKVIVHGHKKGSAVIEARRGTTVVCQLEVGVKAPKIVKVAFNFVKDTAGHKTTRSLASVDNLVKTMNSIYTPQTYITIVKRTARWVQVRKNLGKVVRYSAHLSGVAAGQHEWDDVIALRDAAAHWNVFFVWEYEQDATPFVDHTDAGNLAGNCLFEDKAGVEVGETLAHELGHYLGVADFYDAAQQDWLMYGYTDVRGRFIPKNHANIMNP